jgi:hypothetical protein
MNVSETGIVRVRRPKICKGMCREKPMFEVTQGPKVLPPLGEVLKSHKELPRNVAASGYEALA